jgi:hypothetical protein
LIGSSKLGDNINHNLNILALLYRHNAAGSAKDKMLLRKPITVMIVSIIEAALHDFHSRIRTHTIEDAKNLLGLIEEIVLLLGRKLDCLQEAHKASERIVRLVVGSCRRLDGEDLVAVNNRRRHLGSPHGSATNCDIRTCD